MNNTPAPCAEAQASGLPKSHLPAQAGTGAGKDDTYRNGENGAQRQSSRYDVLDAHRDRKFPVRDSNGYPIGKDGKTDWARVIQEANDNDG